MWIWHTFRNTNWEIIMVLHTEVVNDTAGDTSHLSNMGGLTTVELSRIMIIKWVCVLGSKLISSGRILSLNSQTCNLMVFFKSPLLSQSSVLISSLQFSPHLPSSYREDCGQFCFLSFVCFVKNLVVAYQSGNYCLTHTNCFSKRPIFAIPSFQVSSRPHHVW